MALPDLAALVASSFELDVDGVPFPGVTEVTGLTREQDVVEMKQTGPDGTFVVRHLPGRPKPGTATVTRPLTADSAFETWFAAHSLPTANPGAAATGSTATLTVRSATGDQVRRYKLVNAWPSKLEVSATRVGDTGVLTERLVVAYERIEVT